MCRPLCDTSPEPLRLSGAAWRMSTKSSRCFPRMQSTDKPLYTAGVLPELIALLWKFYFLVEKWLQGLITMIIVPLSSKSTQCSLRSHGSCRSLWINYVTNLRFNMHFKQCKLDCSYYFCFVIIIPFTCFSRLEVFLLVGTLRTGHNNAQNNAVRETIGLDRAEWWILDYILMPFLINYNINSRFIFYI